MSTARFIDEREIAWPFLHECDMATNRFQQSLPRLPIPKLQDTLDKYVGFRAISLQVYATRVLPLPSPAGT